jgi:hypothetical protein
MRHPTITGLLAGVFATLALSAATAAPTYDLTYRVEIDPGEKVARVVIDLAKNESLPSRIEFHIDPERHLDFEGDGKISTKKRQVVWEPPDRGGELRFRFKIDHERRDGMYDSLMTKDWAAFRGDRMIPSVSVTGPREARSSARLEFSLPKDWSIITPYPGDDGVEIPFNDPGRRFDRPKGWMLAGKIGTRRDIITGVETVVAAPIDEGARRQDTLAFLMWNLPHLTEVFPEFPRRLLIVGADDPMFRGGLSGPASLFLHLDRPLISENRTSTLLHELVLVATGLRGDDESDWIVEGLAEYYSIETLRRSGGISEIRYEEALDRLARWGKRSRTLFKKRSSGATTAKAVGVFAAADKEIRKVTGGKRSLDQVAAILAKDRGEVSIERLAAAAEKVAGQPVKALDRKRLGAD